MSRCLKVETTSTFTRVRRPAEQCKHSTGVINMLASFLTGKSVLSLICVDNNTHNAPFHLSVQDYPSLALLGEKLAENNIFLIFAVTKRLYVIYKVLWFYCFILKHIHLNDLFIYVSATNAVPYVLPHKEFYCSHTRNYSRNPGPGLEECNSAHHYSLQCE